MRQAVQQVQPARPRPVVRPTAPPQRVLPNTPAPAQLKSRMRAPVRPTTAPQAGKAAAASRPAVAVAATAGAVGAAAGYLALNAANAHADISAKAASLQNSLSELQRRASFESVQTDLNELDKLVNEVAELLESARGKGYAYQNDLEDKTYRVMGNWGAVRDQTYTALNTTISGLQTRLMTLDPQVQRLNANLYSANAATPHLRSTGSQINNLLAEVDRLEDQLEDRYEELETTTRELNSRLTQIHWALDQLAGAKFQPAHGEDLVMAVAARWDKEGKDDPEGVLYLSNRRLVFERKEKVATKKILFITTASELVQEVAIDRPLAEINAVKADSRGLFGHQDYLLVEFKDKKLGAVALHINGQDLKVWVDLLERTRSGAIENERAGSGAGVSYQDLHRPLTSSDILNLQNEVNSMQDEMMLKEARTELAELENEVRGLERKLAEVRAQGYAIEKDLEADLQVLAVQWDRVKHNAEATLNQQALSIGEGVQAMRQDLARLMGMTSDLAAARPLYLQLRSTVASVQAQADAAETTVFAQYDQYADEVTSMAAHLDWVGWMLGALATASFRLLATESGVAAVEAVFERPGLESENGVLFLTDQRLMWEDRIDAYELKLDVPLSEVLDVRSEVVAEQDQEYLEFKLGAQGPASSVRFRLALPVAQAWLTMVGRARGGGYAQDRAVSISEEELARIRNAPQQCSNCGATYTTPLLRGQTELTCEYCGLVTRI